MDRPLRMVQGMGFLRDPVPSSMQRPAPLGGRESQGAPQDDSNGRRALQSSIDKASRVLEETRGRAQRVIDRYDALSTLVGPAVAAQALDEAKDAFLKAQTAVQDLKQLGA